MEIRFPKSVILNRAENASPARTEGSLPWSNAHKMGEIPRRLRGSGRRIPSSDV